MVTSNRVTRCRAAVYHRDTYRRTGRGKGGFEMHYTREQCRRKAVSGERYCWQHGKPGLGVTEPPWATDNWPPGEYE